MVNFRQLYELHKSSQNHCLAPKCFLKGHDSERRKYRREQIVDAEIFTEVERDFLNLLLVKDEYYMDEVIAMVRKEMERVVD